MHRVAATYSANQVTFSAFLREYWRQSVQAQSDGAAPCCRHIGAHTHRTGNRRDFSSSHQVDGRREQAAQAMHKCCPGGRNILQWQRVVNPGAHSVSGNDTQSGPQRLTTAASVGKN